MDLVIHLDRLTTMQRAAVLDLVDDIYTSQSRAAEEPPTDTRTPEEAFVPNDGALAAAIGASTPPSADTAPSGASPSTVTIGGVSIKVDKTGLPWDQRIHAANQTLNKDGTWRARRGLNDEGLTKRIEAELRNAMKAPAAAVPPPPLALVPPPAPAPAPAVPLPPVASADIPASVPQPPAPAVQGEGPPTTFPEFARWFTGQAQAGKLTNTLLLSTLNAFGLDSLPALATRPDLVPSVYTTLMTLVPA